MTKPATLIRQYVISRPSRRDLSTSSPRRTSTSPQRRNQVAPAVSTPLKSFTDIPGPLALPMLRHSAHVLPRIGTFHHTVGLGLLDGIRDRYGDLVRLAKGSRKRPVLYVFDPEMMREVYESKTTEPPRWDLSPLSKQRQEAGACPIHGEEPKDLWASIRTLLLDGSLTKNYDAAFDEIATDVTRRLEDLRHAENNALNEEIETEVYRWAMETVGLMIFGIRLGCLDGPAHKPTPENSKPLKTSMDDESPDLCSLSSRSMEDLSMAERLVRCSKEIADGGYLVRSEDTLRSDSETFNRALKAFDTQFSLTEHFLNQSLAALKSGERKPEQVLIDKLSPLDRRILPLAADALLAGVNPLAQTAVVMLQQLSLHAAQQQRAHDEVSWSTASVDAGAGRQTLSYIAACAREVMRLHPVTGGVVRRTMEDVAIGGYEVPEGVDIVLAHGVSSKDEKQWGRAKSFIPERWYGESWDPLKASRAHSLASVPFGENCPATGIVGNMLSSLATRVLDKYRLEWHGPAPRMATTGVNRILKPFYFVLQNAA